MKMRNLLRSIPFLLLMMSGLSLVLNCKGPASNSTPTFYTVTFDAQGGSAVASFKAEQGKTIEKPTDPVKAFFTFGGWFKERECTTPWNFASDTVTANITLYAKWTPTPPANVTVTFTVKDGNGTLTAKAGNTELTSPASVKKDTDVAFTPNPSAGYKVDYLLINGVKKSGTTVTVKADKNIIAIVKFKTQGAPETQLFTVDYKAKPMAGGSISAKYSDGTAFSSGGKIETGTSLVFTAEPNSGYTIFTWTGATESPADKKTATLTVTADSSVTVMFAEKQYTVTFDPRNGMSPFTQQVKHGKTVTKPTDPIKLPLSFGGWYKEEECITPWNFATDTVTADITLYAKWQSSPITIRFNPSKMTCKKNGNPVSNNDTVYENDELYFSATPSHGQTVDKWTVNNTEKTDETGASFWYLVQTTDVQGGGITIGYTEKPAQQVTIRFDSSKMVCWKNPDESTLSHTLIADGDSVYENDSLLFMAKPAAGKMVDSWRINSSSVHSRMGNSLPYQVKAHPSDLNIDYTEKNVEKLTLQFDTSKIQCRKLVDNSPIAPGPLNAGDILVFSTKNGSAVTWKANNQSMGLHSKQYVLVLTKEYAKELGNEHILTISYE